MGFIQGTKQAGKLGRGGGREGGAMSCAESHGDSNCILQEWDDRCSLLVPGMNVRAGKGPETLDPLLITKVKWSWSQEDRRAEDRFEFWGQGRNPQGSEPEFSLQP